MTGDKAQQGKDNWRKISGCNPKPAMLLHRQQKEEMEEIVWKSGCFALVVSKGLFFTASGEGWMWVGGLELIEGGFNLPVN